MPGANPCLALQKRARLGWNSAILLDGYMLSPVLLQDLDAPLASAAGHEDAAPGDLAKLLKELQAVKPTLTMDVAFDVVKDNSIRKFGHMFRPQPVGWTVRLICGAPLSLPP